MWAPSKKAAVCKPGRASSPRTEDASTLIFGFPASRTVESRCVLFKQPSLVFWYSSSNWLRQTSWSSYSRFKFKILIIYVGIVVVVQLLSHVWLFATPWTAACQTLPFFTNSWSLLKLMFIESVMPSNHLIFCCLLLLLPSIFPNIFPMSQLFTSGGQSIRASASALVLPVSIQGWFPLGLTGFISLLPIHGTLKSLLQHHNWKASVLRFSAFFMVQLSHPYMTTGKSIALTGQTFVSKVMSLSAF